MPSPLAWPSDDAAAICRPLGYCRNDTGGVLRSRGDSQQLFHAVCQDLFHLRRDP